MNPNEYLDSIGYIDPVGISNLQSKINTNSIYGTKAVQHVGVGKNMNIGMKVTKDYKRLIVDKCIRIPHDMKFNDMILSSKVEPDFLRGLKDKYPEYFI